MGRVGGPAGRAVLGGGAVDAVVGGVDLAGGGPGHRRRAEDEAEAGVDGDPGPAPGMGAELAVVLHPGRHQGVGHVHDQGPLDHEGGDRFGHHPAEEGVAAERGRGPGVECPEATGPRALRRIQRVGLTRADSTGLAQRGRGSLHMGQTGGPPKGRAISPVTSKPWRR